MQKEPVGPSASVHLSRLSTRELVSLNVLHDAVAWKHLTDMLTEPRMNIRYIICLTEMEEDVKDVIQTGDLTAAPLISRSVT
jgi:hypothetical protein